MQCEADTVRPHEARATLLPEQSSVMQMQIDNLRLALPSHLNSDKCSMEQMQHDRCSTTARQACATLLPEHEQVQCDADAARQRQACVLPFSPEHRQIQREADAGRHTLPFIRDSLTMLLLVLLTMPQLFQNSS